MRNHSETIDLVATDLLEQQATLQNTKPNYSNHDFMNTVLISQTALIDKMLDLQQAEDMEFKHRIEMVKSAGNQLRQLIKTFTGIDTHTVHNK